MKQFILETIKRIAAKNPKYFRAMQIALVVIVALCFGTFAAEKYFPEFVPDVVNTIANDIWSYALVLIAAFQLPKQDQP